MDTSSVRFGTARDIVGIVFFGVGLLSEAIADQSKYLFKKNHKGFCNTGIWGYSRHPNYFGEIFLWFGIWIACLSPSANGPVRGAGLAAQYASIVSPLFTVALLFGLSGLPLQEKSAQEKMYKSEQRLEYAEYLRRTSILIPCPPGLYRPLPAILKRTVLLDFPFYQWSPPDTSTSDEESRD